MEDVSKEEFVIWKNSKVTKQFLRTINEKIQNAAEDLVAGATLGEDVAQETAKAVGYIRALTHVYNYEYEEKEEDDSTSRT